MRARARTNRGVDFLFFSSSSLFPWLRSPPWRARFLPRTCDTIRDFVPVKGDYFGLLFAWSFAAEGRRQGQELNTLHKLRRDPLNESGGRRNGRTELAGWNLISLANANFLANRVCAVTGLHWARLTGSKKRRVVWRQKTREMTQGEKQRADEERQEEGDREGGKKV